MQIKDLSLEKEFTAALPYRFIDPSGNTEERDQHVLHEHALAARLPDGSCLHFTCMPQYLPELIAGHLLTEGYIRRAGDIAEICLDESGKQGTVRFTGAVPKERFPLHTLPKASWDISHIFQLANAFAGEMPLHTLTYAAHSCFLAWKGEIVFACEDLGRHNALDKAVGYALIHGLNAEECVLYSSGRMPLDMVSKAIRAGFPILISKGSPTAESVALAKKYGLTLFCAARRDGVKLFTV